MADDSNSRFIADICSYPYRVIAVSIKTQRYVYRHNHFIVNNSSNHIDSQYYLHNNITNLFSKEEYISARRKHDESIFFSRYNVLMQL